MTTHLDRHLKAGENTVEILYLANIFQLQITP